MASVEMEWTEKRIVDELRTKGPFLSAASADPWKNKDPDLESLNGEASEKINGLILAKRRDPAMALAGLILGETGSGKTHMLMRILQRLRGNGQYATFASVRAFLDPESVMRALLKEVVISLEREHHAGLCQLDVVMEKLVDDFSSPDVLHFKHGQPLSDARFAALRKMMPGINRDLLRCLLLHYETDDVGDKELLRDWIAYGLDGEDAKRFGLSERDLSGDSTTKAAGEEDARTMLISLGEVFAHARVPMVVCFDQLDGMTSPGLINAWGNVIVSLIGDAPGFLPLAFLRADTWNERFMGILDNAVPPRFAPIAMFGCTMDQARQLIRRRIEGSFGEGTDEAHRWLMERLEGRLKAGSSPRTVIQMAQRAIDQGLDPELPVDDPLDVIEAAYRKAHDDVAKALKDWPADAERLVRALEAWSRTRKDLFSVERKEDRYPRLSARRIVDGREVGHDFILVTPTHPTSAAAALRRGLGFLKKGRAFFITDERTSLRPSWSQSRRLLDQFKEQGGVALVLDAGAQAVWYGLVSLINAVGNGDVMIWTDAGPRAAGQEDLERWMADRFSEVLLDLDRPTPPPPPPDEEEIDDGRFAELLLGFLDASPIKLLDATHVLVMFQRAGATVAHDRLLDRVSAMSDRFRLFPTKSQTMIGKAKQ